MNPRTGLFALHHLASTWVWLAIVALCVLRCPQTAVAQTAYTLTNTASGGSWAAAANWTPNGTPGGNPGDSALLPLGTLTAAWNLSLNSSPTIAGLTVTNASFAVTLNAGTPATSVLTLHGPAPAITNISGQTLTLNSVVNLDTANAILTTSNNGTIYLVNPGANFFSSLAAVGGLPVPAGTLHFGNVTNGVPPLSTAKTGAGTLQLDLAFGSTFFTNQPSLGGTGERIITGVVSFTNASGGAQTLVNNSTGVLDLQLNPAVSATNFLASLSAVSSISGMNGILDLENLNGTNNLGNLSISTSAANGNFNVLNNSGGNLVNLITGGSFNTGSGTLGLCGGIIFNVDSNNVGFNVGTLVVSSANGGWLYRGGAVTVNWNASGKSLGAVQMCNQGGGPAIFNLLGGSLANTAAFTLGNTGHDYDNSTSTLNVSGGVLAITNSGGLQMSFVTTAPSGSTGPQEYSFLTITNTGVLSIISPGALKAGAVTVSDTATAPVHSESTISLGGGALQLGAPIARQPVATMVNGSSANWVQFFFNGGTLQATTELPQVFTGFGTVNSTADAVYVASGGAVINNGGFTVGISNNLMAASGSTGGLTNLGSGTLTLSGSNTYTGPTLVSAGKLVTTTASSFASSGFSVADGATNQVVVAAPGQTLNVNNLTLGGSVGATLEFNNAGFANPTAPLVVVNGALTLNGTITVNLYGTALAVSPAITLLTYAAKSGSGSFVLGSLPAGVNATLTDTGTQLLLTISSVNPVVTEDAFDVLRLYWESNWLIGNPSAATLSSWAVTASNYWSTLNTNAGRTYLWSDLTLGSGQPGINTGSSHMDSTFGRLESMALAWAAPGCPLQANAALASAITNSLDWMCANIYTTTATEYDNWWDWEIGGLQNFNNAQVLVYPVLTAAQISNYTASVDHFQPPNNGHGWDTGANLTDQCKGMLIRAIIGKNSGKLTYAQTNLSPVFLYVTNGDGYYRDGSFVFHGAHPYAGGYGLTLLGDVSQIVSLLLGFHLANHGSEPDQCF